MTRRVSVGHSREGFALHVMDAPAWTWTVEAVAGSYPVAWVFTRIPALFDAWQWLMSTTDRHCTAEWWVPIPEVTALEMSDPGTWDYVHADQSATTPSGRDDR